MVELPVLPGSIKVVTKLKPAPKPGVDIAVNCSFETHEEPDLMTDPQGILLQGYLKHQSKTQDPHRSPLVKKTLKNGYRHREMQFVGTNSPVISVLLAREVNRSRHGRVASLIHNPLSKGLAQIKALQSPIHAVAVQGDRYHKRSSSVISGEARLPAIANLLHLQGMSISPSRERPSPRTFNLERLIARMKGRRLYD